MCPYLCSSHTPGTCPCSACTSSACVGEAITATGGRLPSRLCRRDSHVRGIAAGRCFRLALSSYSNNTNERYDRIKTKPRKIRTTTNPIITTQTECAPIKIQTNTAQRNFSEHRKDAARTKVFRIEHTSCRLTCEALALRSLVRAQSRRDRVENHPTCCSWVLPLQSESLRPCSRLLRLQWPSYRFRLASWMHLWIPCLCSLVFLPSVVRQKRWCGSIDLIRVVEASAGIRSRQSGF